MFNHKMLRVSGILSLIGVFVLISQGFSGDLKKAENFTLKDYNGKDHSLADYTDSEAIVIMFIATQCPVSNAYNSRMVQLFEEYNEKNVTFLGINSNKQESVKEIAGHSKENGFQFAVLKDENNIIADKYKAQVTPEIFVVNAKMDILYHGRIDDSQREGDVKSQDLRSALDAVLAGKSVAVIETKAFGCSIKRIK